MRYLLTLLIFCGMVTFLYATEEKQFPPPAATMPVDVRNYFQTIVRHLNNISHITVSPSTINGRPGDLIHATYGGNERLCVNTGSGPSTTTTWKCITLGAP